MVVLASVAGNSQVASETLKADYQMNMPPADIRRWRNSTCREEYEKILQDAPDMSGLMIAELQETARLAASAERLAIQATYADLQAGTCKDPARAARDLAHIKEMNLAKSLLLQGRPTQITGTLSPDEMLEGLLRDGIFKPVAAGEEADFELPDGAVIQLPSGLSAG